MMQTVIQFVNHHIILSLTWVSLLISVTILTLKDVFAKTTKITCNTAIQLINTAEAITIDLRSHDEFRKGHIIDSINLTPLEISNHDIQKIEKYKKIPMITVSKNGIEASKPSAQLVQYGFEQVFILKEGIIGWSNKNLPLSHSK